MPNDSIKSIPATYRTSDGQDHPDAATAERHQALIDAVKEHERSAEAVQAALAETHRTADDQLFRWGSRYWRVIDFWAQGPRILYIGPYDLPQNYCDIAMDSGEPCIIPDKWSGKDREQRWERRIRIRELYADHAAAKATLRDAWIGRLRAQIADAEEAVGPIAAEELRGARP